MTGTALVHVSRPRGRPSKYNRDVADAVLELMSAGMSLRRIERIHGMPPRTTVRNWAIDDVDGFAARFARAELMRMDELGDEILDIADTPEIGQRIKVTGNGTVVEISGADMVEHRKLRIHVRMFLMAKLARKRYGDPREAPQADAGPQELRIVVDGGLPDVNRTPKAP